MATLPPTPNLGLVLPDPGTGEPFSTTQFNGWMTTIDSALANTFTKPRLRLTDTSDASLTSTNHALQIGPTTGQNLIMDSNEIMTRDNGAGGNLFINGEGTGVTQVGNRNSRVYLGGLPSFCALPTAVSAPGGTSTISTSDTDAYVQFESASSVRFTNLFAEDEGAGGFAAYEFWLYLTASPSTAATQLIFLGLSGGTTARSTLQSEYRYIQGAGGDWLVGGSAGLQQDASIMPAGTSAITGAVVHGHVYHALSSSERTKIEYEVVSDIGTGTRCVGFVYNNSVDVDDGLRFGRAGTGTVTGRLYCKRVA